MHSITCTFAVFLLIHFSSASPDTICNNTPFPYFCRSVLPNHNTSATIHDYARMSIQYSLSTTKLFIFLVNAYLKFPHTLPKTTVLALQDCRGLAGLNHDFLTNSLETIGSDSTLHSVTADDVQSLLSATLTNQQTCLDGLEAASSALGIRKALLAPLYNGGKLYSISLALFVNGWVRDAMDGKWPMDGRFEFSGSRESHESRSFQLGAKKLVQLGANNIKVTEMVVVDPSGCGNFTTISDAVAAAPNNTAATDGYFVIYVVAGTYEEYVSIGVNKQYLMMIGDGINQTIITGNRSVGDGWTTYSSATFAVVGQGFVAVNMTIRNTAGAAKHQAVALRNGADLSSFYSCSIEGYQDTLYAFSLRQFYKQCDIYGTVDFIFGNAAVVFQNCNMLSRVPMQGQFNVITAQGRTDINQNTGISIHNCSIKATQELASKNGTVQTFLGRPWKQYSRTVVMQSYLEGSINPAGWAAWSGNFALDTLYYAEYNNWGPGSGTDNRTKWLGYHMINETDAANFTVSTFIWGDNWLPGTIVPYAGGLQ